MVGLVAIGRQGREVLQFVDDAVHALFCGDDIVPQNPPPMRRVKEGWVSTPGGHANVVAWPQETEAEALAYQRFWALDAPDQWAGARFEALA